MKATAAHAAAAATTTAAAAHAAAARAAALATAHAAALAAADAAAYAATTTAHAADTTTTADAAARAAATAHAAAAHATGFWDEVRPDLMRRPEAQSILKAPLWQGEEEFEWEWQKTRADWREAGLPWSYFADWYDELLAGSVTNWDELVKLALIDPDDWEGHDAPEKVAAHIRRLQLPPALKATSDAERVRINPETGKLRVDPVSDIPDDYLADVLSMLEEALDLFPDGNSLHNQHTALRPEIDLVRRTVEKYANRPRMIHKNCGRVLRRLAQKIDNAECPAASDDADVADFQGLLADATATLLTWDPMVQEAVNASAAAKMPEISEEKAEEITAAVEEIAAVSEGVLKEELPQQARDIRDASLSEEERKEAFLSLAGRALRVWTLSAFSATQKGLEEIEKISKTLSGISKNLKDTVGHLATAGVVATGGWTYLRPFIDWLLTLF